MLGARVVLDEVLAGGKTAAPRGASLKFITGDASQGLSVVAVPTASVHKAPSVTVEQVYSERRGEC
jgi:hypothetical protein